MSDWVPESRPVPPELESSEHATFPPPPVRWPTVAERLDEATREQLVALMNSGLGDVGAPE